MDPALPPVAPPGTAISYSEIKSKLQETCAWLELIQSDQFSLISYKPRLEKAISIFDHKEISFNQEEQSEFNKIATIFNRLIKDNHFKDSGFHEISMSKVPQQSSEETLRQEIQLLKIKIELLLNSSEAKTLGPTLNEINQIKKQINALADPALYNEMAKEFNELVVFYNDKKGGASPIVALLTYKFEDEGSLSPEKKTFLESLNIKSLGHLVADSFLLDAKNAQDEPLEGMQAEDAMKFMRAALNYLPQLEPELFKDKSKQLKEVEKLLVKSESYAEMIKGPVAEMSKTILTDIQNLKENERLLIPSGWKNAVKAGHAMLIECIRQKDGVIFKVYNTGGGTEFHQTDPEGNKLHGNTIRNYSIPMEELSKSIPLLLQPLIYGRSSIMKDNKDFSANEIYVTLAPYARQDLDSVEEDAWMKLQMSGTCTLRVLFAFLTSVIGKPAYKKFKDVWEKEAAREILNHPNYYQYEPYLQKMLGKAIDNLFGHLLKEESVDEARLEDLEKLQIVYRNQFPEAKTTNSPFPEPDSIQSANIKKIVSERRGSVSGSYPTSNYLNPVIPKGISSIAEYGKLDKNALNAHISTLKSFLRAYQNLEPSILRSLISDSLLQLGQIFLDPSLESHKIELLKSLDNSEAVAALIKDIVELTHYMGVPETYDPKTILAHYNSVVIGWELGKLKDNLDNLQGKSRLDAYALDSHVLERYFTDDKPPWIVSFGDPDYEKNYGDLLNYFKSTQVGNKPVLHDFKFTDINQQWALDEGSGDYIYAASYVQSPAFSKWSGMARGELDDKRASSQVVAEEWNATWAYTNNKLPEQFIQLRRLTVAAAEAFPYAKTRPDELKPGFISYCKPPSDLDFSTTLSISGKTPCFKRTHSSLNERQHWNVDSKIHKQFHKIIPYDDVGENPNHPLFGVVQNELLCQVPSPLHEQLSINAANHENQVLLLLDYFRKNPTELTDPKQQLYFETILFRPFNLRDSLERFPQLTQELRQFYEEMDLFLTHKAAPVMSKSKVAGLQAFLTTQKVRTLTYIADQKYLEEARGGIRLKLTQKEYKETEAGITLLFSLIESYKGNKTLDDKQAAEIIKANATISYWETLLGLDMKTFLTSHQIAQDTIFKIQNELKKYFKISEKQSCLSDICKLYSLDFSAISNIQTGFPVVTFNYRDSPMTFDMVTGRLRVGEIPLKELPTKIMNSEAYRSQFGTKRLVGHSKNNIFETNDELSAIRISSEEIQRNFNGKWYTWTKLTNRMFPDSHNHSDWKNDAGSVITHNKNKKVEYVIDDEGVAIGNQAKKYQVCFAKDIPQLKGLIPFSADVLFWQREEPGTEKEMFLQFPKQIEKGGDYLKFVKKEDQLVWEAHPELHIAKDQTIVGLQNFKSYLIVENDKGEKEVLIADVPFKSEVPLQQCARYRLIGNRLERQRGAAKNLNLARLYLSHAYIQQDYEKVLQLLQASREFRRFTPEEFRLLGLIANLGKVRPDSSGEAQAIKLYALWMTQDNLSKYPKELNIKSEGLLEMPKEDDLPEIWEKYWASANQRGFVENPLVKEIAKNYQERENNIPKSLRLRKLLNFPAGYMQGLFGRPQIARPHLIKADSSIWRKLQSTPAKELPDSFQLRVGSEGIGYYHSLKEKIERGTPEDIHYVLQFLTYADQDSKFLFLNRILGAHLIEKAPMRDVTNDLRSAARIVIDYWNELIAGNEKNRAEESYFETSFEKINQYFYGRYLTQLNVSGSTSESGTGIKTNNDFEKRALDLPATPLKRDLGFAIEKNLLNDTLSLFERSFKKPEISKDAIPSFDPYKTVKRTEPFIASRIQNLREDYHQGYRRNLEIKGLSLLKSPEETKDQFLSEYPQLKKQNEEDQKNLKSLETNILDNANRALKTDPKLRAKIGARKRSLLSIDDCILLFLKGSQAEFQKKTGIADPKSIQLLYKTIGNYLELSIKSKHMEAILPKLIAIKEVTGEQLENDLNEIGDLLAKQHHTSSSNHPEALLVFEHKMGILLRDYQVEGLNDTTEDLIIQKIQGGGKTLVWGHLLAYLKADGYHLSIHVSPSHQYASTLYEMGERSQHLFGQQERTLIFDDNPAYFTKVHLQTMRDNLKLAILDREYVNTTSETLRALRCKYIKSQLEVHTDPKLTDDERKDLSEKIAILEETLSLLRERGKFTFDEAHLAFDPRNELNMPYGRSIHPNSKQVDLIGKLLRSAVTAKDKNGLLLIKIKQNLQSQQTVEQRSKMLVEIANALINDPEWQKLFEADTSDKQKELKSYLLNADADLPRWLQEFVIKDKGEGLHQHPAHLAILAHQMLAKGWLSEELSKNVREHFGIVEQEDSPPIAIPFKDNMKPMFGSDFSNTFVMISKTLIAYLVDGLSTEQAKEFVNQIKNKAIVEYEFKKEEDPNFTIESTKAFQQFKSLCEQGGLNETLLTFDTDNMESIKGLQKALLVENDDVMQSLINFINEKVIQQVDLFTEEVSSNGQNTATMAKGVNAYTASLDNPNIAPVMDSKGRTAKAKPDVGTNGQTVDLLLNKNTDAWIVGSTAQDLFADCVDQMEPTKKSRLRAIIDVGCQFRGMDNYKASRYIVEKLDKINPKLKGVLFFDPTTDKLCFMNKCEPGKVPFVKELRGFDPKTIKEDTGYSSDELFTYYDQYHTTGVDLVQAKNAVALVTVSEESTISKKLQGDRRFRGLDYFQEIVTTVQQGSLEKLSQEVSRDDLKTLSKGHIAESKDFLAQTVLFLEINQAKQDERNNFMLLSQKMENVVTQYLLDEVFAKRLAPQDVFTKGAPLFKKNTDINLYRDYAQKRQEMDIGPYFELMAARLISQLEKISMPEQDLATIKTTLGELAKKTEGIKPKIEVNPEVKSLPIGENREGIMVQTRQKEKKSVDKKEQEEDVNVLMVTQNTELRNKAKSFIPAVEIPLTREELFSRDFGTPSSPQKQNLDEIFSAPNMSDYRQYGESGLQKWMKDVKDFQSKAFKEAEALLQQGFPSSQLYRMLKRKITDSQFSYDWLDKSIKIPTSLSAKAMIDDYIQKNQKDYTEDRFMQWMDESFGGSSVSRSTQNSLKDLLSTIDQQIPPVFDPHLVVTQNFIKAEELKINLLDTKQKPVQQALLICDELAGKKEWKMVLLSVNEGEQISEHLKSEVQMVQDRTMWLIRPQGELSAASKIPFSFEKIRKDPAAMRLIVQALFFGGDTHYLSRKPWIESFKAWLTEINVNDRKKLKELFETHLLNPKNLKRYQEGISKLFA